MRLIFEDTIFSANTGVILLFVFDPKPGTLMLIHQELWHTCGSVASVFSIRANPLAARPWPLSPCAINALTTNAKAQRMWAEITGESTVSIKTEIRSFEISNWGRFPGSWMLIMHVENTITYCSIRSKISIASKGRCNILRNASQTLEQHTSRSKALFVTILASWEKTFSKFCPMLQTTVTLSLLRSHFGSAPAQKNRPSPVSMTARISVAVCNIEHAFISASVRGPSNVLRSFGRDMPQWREHVKRSLTSFSKTHQIWRSNTGSIVRAYDPVLNRQQLEILKFTQTFSPMFRIIVAIHVNDQKKTNWRRIWIISGLNRKKQPPVILTTRRAVIRRPDVDTQCAYSVFQIQSLIFILFCLFVHKKQVKPLIRDQVKWICSMNSGVCVEKRIFVDLALCELQVIAQPTQELDVLVFT